MHLTAYFSLICSTIAMAGFMQARRWLFAAIWGFLAAYTLFDKFYSHVLPQPLVESFSVISFLLAILGLTKVIVARRKRHNRQISQGTAE
ncbi:hypothetical protein [Massilia phyllosphaerae]|uniref:hypothetical protein n=1 Tax=Massilia phyllosphaerae TaxID=3106034 RepID=UPI002B1CD171|nr:hypothetical protein [Massilia sp. SGZ-792]